MAADSIPAPVAAACVAVRPAGPADAVAGVQPSVVATPSSTQEAAALLRAAAELGLAVVPRGTGSKLAWGNPPHRCDLVVETAGLDRVLEHEAGDLVATVQAGIGLDRLAEALGAAGQRLALDPPRRPHPVEGTPHTRGTVGGVLSAGAAGPLRLRYGTGRDLLIGITIVRADGTVARSGGKVVKNVAGYDMGKLFAGSRGTLGLIAEATFRLHPVPAATAYVVAQCPTPADAYALLAAAVGSPHAPVAAEIDWPGDGEPLGLAVALEGDKDGAAARAAMVADLLVAAAAERGGTTVATLVSRDPPTWWGAGPRHAGAELQVAFWPGDLENVLVQTRNAARQARIDPAIGGSAAAGVLHASLPADADADAGQVGAFVSGLRAALGPGRPLVAAGLPARASVVVLHAPAAVAGHVDMFGPVPSIELMRAVKHQFDPEQAMSPGRFAGGI